METFGDAVTQFRSAEGAGFDVLPAQAALLLQEGAERLAARSEAIRAEMSFGATVAGQEEYALPSNVVKVKGLAVAGTPYISVDVLTIWQYKQRGLPPGVDAAYAERHNEDGKIQLLGLLPVPDTDGLAIEGLCAILPGALEDGDTLPFPPQYRRAVLYYATGVGYEQLDENIPAASEQFERADAMADDLRLYVNSRTGSGPYRIPVASARRR